MTVLDAHCDAPSQMYRGRDYGRDNDHAQVDFPKMKRGGVDASFFALYIPAELKEDEAVEYASRLLAEVRRQVEANSDKVAFATSREEVIRNKKNGLISILLGIENASAIGRDLHLLESYYKSGVRYITLTHSADNLVGDSCSGAGSWGGLTRFGREVVREMNGLGMLVDLAHSADSTIRDVLEMTSAPVVYTHGCCRALCRHRRNLSDELVKAVADTGGVVGMSIYPVFMSDDFAPVYQEAVTRLDSENVERRFILDPLDKAKLAAWNETQDKLAAVPRPGVEVVADHIVHALNIAGEKHVGIGTDYDGIDLTADGLENVSSFGLLFDALRRRGLASDVIEGVAGRNFLDLL